MRSDSLEAGGGWEAEEDAVVYLIWLFQLLLSWLFGFLMELRVGSLPVLLAGSLGCTGRPGCWMHGLLVRGVLEALGGLEDTGLVWHLYLLGW
jgi:hypothetical protein